MISFGLSIVFLLLPRASAAQDASLQNLAASTEFDQNLGAELPLDAAFRDETGMKVRLGDFFRTKPVLLTLVYYKCPMLCTMTLNGVVRTLRVLKLEPGTDYEVVTVSFDPKETQSLAAAKKKSYLAALRRPGADGGWHFLTGDLRSIERLTKAAGFHFVYDAKSGQYAHSAGLLVATPDGRLSRYFYGVEYSPKDVRLGLIEASEGKLGSAVDKVLLLCYRYDPSTGHYGFYVIRILRLLAAATALSLAGWAFQAARRVPTQEADAEPGAEEETL
jgi:protein SCO1/2